MDSLGLPLPRGPCLNESIGTLGKDLLFWIRPPLPRFLPFHPRLRRLVAQTASRPYRSENTRFHRSETSPLIRNDYNGCVKTSIVVEDDPDISRLVRHHLEGAGFAVRLYSAGDDPAFADCRTAAAGAVPARHHGPGQRRPGTLPPDSPTADACRDARAFF